MKKIQNLIRNYFGFSQKEANGFMILSVLMVLVFIAPLIYEKFESNEVNTEKADHYLLDSLVKVIEGNTGELNQVERVDPVVAEVKYFAFDPNTISAQQWEALGLSSKLSARIINYCSKGGRFKIKKDLLKIYGFPPDQFFRLSSYILLPDTLNSKSLKPDFQPNKIFEKKSFPVLANFDINLADTNSLKNIKGIGSKLSLRIIKYREKLGGFVRMAQVKEVYGLDSLVIEELVHYTFISKDFKVKKININTASANDLSSHPYFSKKIANAIVNFRVQHNSFKSLSDLKEIKIISETDIQKIQDYIDF